MSAGQIDAWLFAAIYGGSNAASGSVLAARVVAKFLIYCLPLHMAVLWLWGDNVRRQTALALLLALVCALGASYLIGLGFHRPRPFLAGLGEALMAHRPSPSFPSNHALIFSTYASTLLLLRQYRTGAVVFLAGLMVGAARIYLGIHYPGDIAGGILLGVFAAMAGLWIWARWGSRLYRAASALWRYLLRPVRRLLEIPCPKAK